MNERFASFLHHALRYRLDEGRGLVVAASRERVGYGLVSVTVDLQPRRGSAVQLNSVEDRAGQPAAQHVGKQGVVAEPSALLIQGGDEHVIVLEPLEALPWPSARPVSASHNGPQSRASSDVARRKSFTAAGRLTEDLVDEVVEDVAVRAVEPRDEDGRGPCSP